MNGKKTCKLRSEIKSVVIKHGDRIKKVDTSSLNIAKIVKSLDTIVNDMYLDLYSIRDDRKLHQTSTMKNNKNGHCC